MSVPVRPDVGLEAMGDLALWPLREGLRRRLLALDYADFARVCCRLLEAMGYEDPRLCGRREWKGYNRPGGGGWDLEAALPGGIAPRRVIAQAKQFDGLPVHQRQVDELRGACVRAGAAEALLVTTSAFSRTVRRHSADVGAAVPPLAPIRLIDGEELTALMVLHRVGVRETRTRGERRLEIDGDFFHGPGVMPRKAPGEPAGERRPPAEALPIRKLPDRPSTVDVAVSGVPFPRRWLVTVRILRGTHGKEGRPRGEKGKP